MMLNCYRDIQSVARSVMGGILPYITRETSENDLVQITIGLFAKYGITKTWYYDVPALILLGSHSCFSGSGRNYVPADEKVGKHNLVTIDLSPLKDGIWGDYARSIAVENGRAVLQPGSSLFKEGLETEQWLHRKMMAFATTDTKISELSEYGNELIHLRGYENLDYLGNLGHSIESHLESRRFIDSMGDERLGNIGLFTFEPHIRKKGTKWGFKHEDIYYFATSGRLCRI